MINNSFINNLGNILILISLFSLAYIYYPIAQIYLFDSEPPPITNTDSFLTIPSIKAQAPIIFDVNPWKKDIYQEALKNGIAHAQDSAKPGQSGTIFLFAHSSAPPWEITRYNTTFLRLGNVNQNDEIIITYQNKEYKYQVFDKKVVWPNEIQHLTDLGSDQLILQTCTPPGTALKRLLVFAAPI